MTLAHRLIDRGWEVVLLGGPEDEWVKSYFGTLTVTDCIGTLSLPEVIRTFDTCDAVVSHDTGPLHLAAMTQTPTVACLVHGDGTDPKTNRRDLIALFISKGANPLIPTREGKTALDLCRDPELKIVLEQYVQVWKLMRSSH